MQKNTIQSIMSKQMDRKEFVKHVSLAFLAFVGLSKVMDSLGALSHGGDVAGYGETHYGS
jgi:hypothetical protein